jgi:aldehyde:ferredoxin oxidoreductase
MDLYPVEAKGGGVISCSLYLAAESVGVPGGDLLLEITLSAQRYGVDIISSMAIITWLMELYEKGVITAKDTDGIPMEWGSRQAIIGMLRKIVYREGFGDVLADGILPAAERIGRGVKDSAPHMKGLPQRRVPLDKHITEKGRALALVMSSRADLMKGWAGTGLLGTFNVISFLRGPEEAAKWMEPHHQKLRGIAGSEKGLLEEEYEGKPELVIFSEDTICIADCLSACKHTGTMLVYPFQEEYQAALFSAGSGVETSVDMLFRFAKRVRNLERAYCVREGMTRETDSLPKRLKRLMDKPIEQGEHKGEVLKSSKFEQMKSKYYTLRGWDVATGIPTRETLEQTGLKDVAKDLEKRGKLPGKSPKGQSKTEKS